MEIQSNFSLKKYNTFGVEALAKQFVRIDKEDDLMKLFANRDVQKSALLFLGGGSNMLFVNNYNGLVVFMAITGISKKPLGDHLVQVTAGGGVVWNDLVNYCVSHNLSGIENLSLIPGTVGAAPVQNIGAYGVELKDVFHSCRAFDIECGVFVDFSKEDCAFGYRDSVFKRQYKGRYIITEVNLLLSTQSHMNTSYGAINEELKARHIIHPTVKDVSEVVAAIRVSKLPDPSTIGNAGSFFKNPIVSVDTFRTLVSDFVDIVHFPYGENQIKLAAGWLIEQCGWKGKVVGHTGTWKNQALVLVNYGNATGLEIYDLSEVIIECVKQRFGIVLEREVNVII